MFEIRKNNEIVDYMSGCEYAWNCFAKYLKMAYRNPRIYGGCITLVWDGKVVATRRIYKKKI